MKSETEQSQNNLLYTCSVARHSGMFRSKCKAENRLSVPKMGHPLVSIVVMQHDCFLQILGKSLLWRIYFFYKKKECNKISSDASEHYVCFEMSEMKIEYLGFGTAWHTNLCLWPRWWPKLSWHENGDWWRISKRYTGPSNWFLIKRWWQQYKTRKPRRTVAWYSR